VAQVALLHTAAVAARLGAILPSNVDIYVGKVDKADADITFPYLVLWPTPASRANDSLAGYTGGNASTRLQITGAGQTKDEALGVLDEATEALQGFTPTITGRSCGQIRMSGEDPAPIRVDPEHKTREGRDVFFGFIVVELSSSAS
jgi:hypothetical protein